MKGDDVKTVRLLLANVLFSVAMAIMTSFTAVSYSLSHLSYASYIIPIGAALLCFGGFMLINKNIFKTNPSGVRLLTRLVFSAALTILTVLIFYAFTIVVFS
jgi:hypothetical protein